eukprot:gene15437-17013_t
MSSRNIRNCKTSSRNNSLKTQEKEFFNHNVSEFQSGCQPDCTAWLQISTEMKNVLGSYDGSPACSVVSDSVFMEEIPEERFESWTWTWKKALSDECNNNKSVRFSQVVEQMKSPSMAENTVPGTLKSVYGVKTKQPEKKESIIARDVPSCSEEHCGITNHDDDNGDNNGDDVDKTTMTKGAENTKDQKYSSKTLQLLRRSLELQRNIESLRTRVQKTTRKKKEKH